MKGTLVVFTLFVLCYITSAQRLRPVWTTAPPPSLEDQFEDCTNELANLSVLIYQAQQEASECDANWDNLSDQLCQLLDSLDQARYDYAVCATDLEECDGRRDIQVRKKVGAGIRRGVTLNDKERKQVRLMLEHVTHAKKMPSKKSGKALKALKGEEGGGELPLSPLGVALCFELVGENNYYYQELEAYIAFCQEQVTDLTDEINLVTDLINEFSFGLELCQLQLNECVHPVKKQHAKV